MLSAAEFAGRNAVVTGAANGIGDAVACELHRRGAKVLALDLSDSVHDTAGQERRIGRQCDVSDPSQVTTHLSAFAASHGPLDLLVSNAGAFLAGSAVDTIDLETWERSMRVNLTSHLIVLKEFLGHVSVDPPASIVMVGSRNVAAPGPGAAAYSVPKAGLVQLVRVAALELGPRGIRINIVHPDAVFETALWTEEALQSSAARYGLTVEQYKKQNVLGMEIRLSDVTNAICLLLGDSLAKTTGAQLPVDGGHLRVI